MTTEDVIRAALGKTMQAWLTDEAANHNTDYAAVRPLPLYGARGGGYPPGRKRSDCSWGARLVCYWTPGAPDPMDSSYTGGGNSSTICARLDHLDYPAELRVGDPVTFGWNGDEHVAVTLEPGSDPLMFSDGHEGAPNTYRLSWDRRIRQLLRLHVVSHPLTHDDILRAKTGYWAWLQWRLGEGSWRLKAPADARVRPDVPERITPEWWHQYARFVANRDKPNPPTAPVTVPA